MYSVPRGGQCLTPQSTVGEFVALKMARAHKNGQDHLFPQCKQKALLNMRNTAVNKADEASFLEASIVEGGTYKYTMQRPTGLSEVNETM